MPKNPDLWVLSVQLEIEAGNKKAAIFTLNKALQECPRHGELWSLSIELEPKTTRKKKSADAVTMCVDDPYVYNRYCINIGTYQLLRYSIKRIRWRSLRDG